MGEGWGDAVQKFTGASLYNTPSPSTLLLLVPGTRSAADMPSLAGWLGGCVELDDSCRCRLCTRFRCQTGVSEPPVSAPPTNPLSQVGVISCSGYTCTAVQVSAAW